MSPRFRKFLSYYKPYCRLLWADMLCAMLYAAIALAIPLVIRTLSGDVLAQGGDAMTPTIYQLAGALLALVLVQTACGYFYDYRGHAMGAMMERDLRNELFAHYQKLSFSFFDENKPGKLMSRLTSDLLGLAELYHHGPEDLVIYSIKFTGALLILWRIHARLTCVVLLFLPVVAIFTLIVGKRLYAAFTTSLDAIADVHAQAEDNLSGIRVVKSFANEALETAKFSRENDRYAASRCNIYKHEAVFYQGVQLFSQCVIVAVVVFGGMSIAGGTLGAVDIITFLLYVNYLVEPMTKLAHIFRQYREGIAGFNRFADILDIAPDVRDTPNMLAPAQVKGHVRFEQVGFRYRDELDKVLHDVSFDVMPGERVAVVGTSGVGKTTLCALIPRFYEASEGRVTIDGMDVREIALHALRTHVGVVQQDVYLFAGTVLDNIRYGRPDADESQVLAAARRANAHDFIQALPQGYQTDIGPRGVKLSGGQRQRISIARTFLKDPRILILDEATSALDNESERIVQASLESLSTDRTTIIIAHRLSTIRGAQRIIVLSDHGVAEQGTHDQLLAQDGPYARLYNAQLSL